ncbi:MAG: sigma-70 family RNA polymerase sigma factor, partial [Planctomycetota bacterium]
MRELPFQRPEALLAHDGFVRALARRLILDAHDAEDVAQQTWVAALEHPADPGRPLRRWLAAVTRNFALRVRRDRGRWHRLQQALPRPAGAPSTEEVILREALRRQVVDAVLGLAEPYRSAILLRFYEDLPPREMARRLQVPVETAKTHVKRGLLQLRQRLDREHGGDRSSWCEALMPIAGSTTAAGGLAAILGGIVAMDLKLKIALGACFVLAAGVAIRHVATANGSSPAGAVSTPEAGMTTSAVLNAMAGAAASPVRPLVRAEAAAKPQDGDASATGSLIVHVTWKDGTPAADMGAFITPKSTAKDYDSFPLMATTDAEGTFRMDDLPVGEVEVLIPYSCGTASGAIQAGSVTELAILMRSPLITVEGLVVDGSDRPVGGAGIWISWDYFKPAVLAGHAAGDGSFRLRDVAGYSVGARAAGYAPSYLHRLAASAGTTVWLKLVLPGPGGTLEGQVLDPNGAPVENAIVIVESRFGTSTKLDEKGEILRSVVRFSVASDVEGRFRFEGLPPAYATVLAWRPGFAPASTSAAVVARETSRTTLVLGKGALLTGRVSDAGGGGIAECRVSVQSPQVMVFTTLVSGEDGSFRLEDVAPGKITLRVYGGSHGTASTTLEVAPGGHAHWDAVLTRGLELVGTLKDIYGYPLTGWMIRGLASTHTASDRTDAWGRFLLANCVEEDYTIRVSEPGGEAACLVLEGVRPGNEELTITIPNEAYSTAFIEGTILGPGGAAEPNAAAVVRALAGGEWNPPRRQFAVAATHRRGFGRVRGARLLAAANTRRLMAAVLSKGRS